MFNRALQDMKEPGLLWEIDADELWTSIQIEMICSMFQANHFSNCADFYCRYFVGHHIAVDRVLGTWTNSFDTMWRRAWRFEPGMVFKSHEPPIIDGQVRNPFTHDQTEANGCVFDHYAYVTEEQVRFKECYYGYRGALEGWRRLQQNTQWPARLKNFLPWIKDETSARPLYV